LWVAIKWVPFAFRQKCLEGIVKKMTGDEKTVITRNEPRNLWFFQFTTGPKEIPHYLDLEVAGEINMKQAIVYLPGRKTACLMFGEDTHWENNCPKKETKRNQKQRNSEMTEKSRQSLTSPIKNGKVSQEKSRKVTDKPREGSPLPKAISEKGARPIGGHSSNPWFNKGPMGGHSSNPWFNKGPMGGHSSNPWFNKNTRKPRRETKIKTREPETPLTESESDADSRADTEDESAQDAQSFTEGAHGLISACVP
jgi:hypothetical protein